MLIANTIQRSDLRERLTVGGSDTVTEMGGGAVKITKTGGSTVFARIRPMRGREYLEARQIVGGTPYDVIVDYPLPAGVTLTSDSTLTWHSVAGNMTLHLTSPPALMLGDRYINFLAVVKS